jgi:hypothetical protein
MTSLLGEAFSQSLQELRNQVVGLFTERRGSSTKPVERPSTGL